MFAPLPDAPQDHVTVHIDGEPFAVPADATAASAMLMRGESSTRTTPVSGAPRAPYCMMGVCFECLMEIDGEPNQQGCLVIVADGMRIARQIGKRKVDA
jgi:predicted molibdopterin-dependent oxidoreductase YjgC